MHIRRTLLAALAAAALSACGDNPAEQAPTPPPAQAGNEVPASAFTSTTAYSTYAAMLAPSDNSEPLKLGPAAAPTSETEEPLPVPR